MFIITFIAESDLHNHVRFSENFLVLGFLEKNELAQDYLCVGCTR